MTRFSFRLVEFVKICSLSLSLEKRLTAKDKFVQYLEGEFNVLATSWSLPAGIKASRYRSFGHSHRNCLECRMMPYLDDAENDKESSDESEKSSGSN